MALDPDFKRNKWVYVYRSIPGNTPVDDPATPDVNEGDAPFFGTQQDWNRFRGTARLSRFKFKPGQGTLDLTTEQTILNVTTDRGICCHMGGKLAFDNRGNLYMSTGDDTNPFESDGYTPIDEREGRNPAFDAQRTSGNTNDLRGKLLRIRPRENVGGYDIPPGNLFPVGAPQTRPEIYAMGLRNPFRFSVDAETGDVYLADYSPDARAAEPLRGPAGQGRWTIIRRPGNYGWPYCATRSLPYVDYDFETETSGNSFNCNNPVNDSRHNTGLRQLPTVVQPDVWYSYGASAEFPSLGTGGIAPMAGPAYQFKKNNPSATKFPAYLDGVPLFAEWSRDRVWEMRIGDNGKLLTLDPFLRTSGFWDNVMDMEFGPDGALYYLNYDDGFYSANPNAELARIDYVRDGNRSPVVDAAADVTIGSTPLQVRFSSAGTYDPDGDRLTYAWDFDADGTVDSNAQNPTFTYTENGVYFATLRVTDRLGRYGRAAVRIAVGNLPPEVSIVAPEPGLAFEWGDEVAYEIEVTDDQPVDCSKVTMRYSLGHANHAHPLQTASGCSGTITTSLASGHSPEDNLRAVFIASYTDPGAENVPPLSGTDQVVLTP
jgi:glucose/arabinose dehydrogenase